MPPLAPSRTLLADNVAFRRLWTGEVAVDLAAGLRRVAVPWLVLVLTGSPLQVGVSFALMTAPDVVLSPLVGYVVDRWPRRRVLAGAALAEAGALAAVPLAAGAGRLSVHLVYAVLVVVSVLGALYTNAREAVLPALVADRRLDEANASVRAAEAALSLVFVGAGGVLTGTVGAVPTLAGAAAALAAAAPVLAAVPESPRESGGASTLRGVLRDVRTTTAGGLAVLRRPFVRDVVLSGMAINAAVVPYAVLVATIGWEVFGAAVAYAALQVAYRGGSLAGTVVVDRVPWSRAGTYAAGILGVGAGASAVAAAGPAVVALPTAAGVVGLGALLAAVGVAMPLLNVPSDSMVQAAAGDDERGTVVALANAAVQVPFPFAYVAGGYLATQVSPFAVFGLSGVAMVALGAVVTVRFDVVPAVGRRVA